MTFPLLGRCPRTGQRGAIATTSAIDAAGRTADDVRRAVDPDNAETSAAPPPKTGCATRR